MYKRQNVNGDLHPKTYKMYPITFHKTIVSRNSFYERKKKKNSFFVLHLFLPSNILLRLK